MTDAKTSGWQFWQPLSFWKVLGVFFITNIIAAVFVVSLREGLGLTWIPTAAIGGVGGLLGVFAVNNLAKKARRGSAT